MKSFVAEDSFWELFPQAAIGDEVEVLAGLRAGERIATDPVAAAQALLALREAAVRD